MGEKRLRFTNHTQHCESPALLKAIFLQEYDVSHKETQPWLSSAPTSRHLPFSSFCRCGVWFWQGGSILPDPFTPYLNGDKHFSHAKAAGKYLRVVTRPKDLMGSRFIHFDGFIFLPLSRCQLLFQKVARIQEKMRQRGICHSVVSFPGFRHRPT